MLKRVHGFSLLHHQTKYMVSQYVFDLDITLHYGEQNQVYKNTKLTLGEAHWNIASTQE